MSFADVVGHEHAIHAIKGQLARGGGAGSTLIVGPDGVGRFLLAHRAARAILGDAPLVDSFHHPDLNLLQPGDGIDGVRAAAATLQKRPASGPRQVLLVRDVDLFSVEAHNALLKTLEEPPGGAAIFLTAADVTRLPDTVISRCRLVRTRALTDEETASVLERHGVSPDFAPDAEGSPGRALYHKQKNVPKDADRLVGVLCERGGDPMADVDRILRRKKDEDSKAHRKRMVEVCRLAATRLRRRLPESESALRLLIEALGSLDGNANPAILFADLALTPWRKTSP